MQGDTVINYDRTEYYNGSKKCLILVADFTTGQVMQGGQVSDRGVILIDSGKSTPGEVKSTPSEVIFSFTGF